jgi:hypothetical protein
MRRLIEGSARLLLIAAALAGCANSGRPVDIGDNRPTARLGASLIDYAGAWDGYVEAFKWNDGSDRLRITLDEHGNGVVQVGAIETLPPPDPDLSYPPGDTNAFTAGNMGVLVAGFEYPISGANVASNRIQFDTASRELFREWCALQAPTRIVDDSWPGEYACLPAAGTVYEDGHCAAGPNGGVPFNCGKLPCLFYCACWASGCEVADVIQDVQLDASLEEDGEQLAGTLVLREQRVFVRMNRL